MNNSVRSSARFASLGVSAVITSSMSRGDTPMKRILATLLMAASLGIGSAACGVADTDEIGEEDAVAEAQGELSSPATFPDCVAGGQDCCNPICRAGITACCVSNSCGMPVASVVYGKGPWTGLRLECSMLTGGLTAVEEAPAE